MVLEIEDEFEWPAVTPLENMPGPVLVVLLELKN